jgi:hypothetical protein
MRGQWQVIRAFLSGSVDDLAFQDVSLHRQVSIIYTPNGALIYRWVVGCVTTGIALARGLDVIA